MNAPRGTPPPHLSSAGALMGEGRFEEARTLLLRHVQQGARGGGGSRVHPHALYMLGMAADTLGEPEQAMHYLERAAGAGPDDPMLAVALAHARANRGRLAEGVAGLEKFAATHAADAGVATTLSSGLSELGRDEEGLRVAEGACGVFGYLPELAGALGGVLEKVGRVEDALAAYRRGGRIVKEGTLLLHLGRVEKAVELFRSATEKYPDDDAAWMHYAYVQNYWDRALAEEQARAHREFGRALRGRVGAAFAAWNVGRDPERRLRVGIVSPDLRRHAIVSFLGPLLEGYDRAEWHVTAYSTSRKSDDVTVRLRGLVDGWRSVPNPHPKYLANLIRGDRVDVAIELSGYTEGNSMGAMHLRPAPVQVTYLGYPNTTGLETVDVRVVDSVTDPAGSEGLALEQLARIDPCFLCYTPIVDAPELAPSPCAGRKPVAFGSFNLPVKMSARTLAAWGRVLKAVEGSRLVLKHAVLTQPWMRADLARRLSVAGIDEGRVTVLPPMPSYSDHLGAYAQVDIALDTFPYHGTTTTCEALWMGVPVVTLMGDRHASRVGGSLLGAIGLSELAAGDEDGFVRIAASLAGAPERLSAWRTPGEGSLRERMAGSALCDGKAFCSRFQGAVRGAWREWCRTK